MGSMDKLLNRSQEEVRRLQKNLQDLSIKFRLQQRKADQVLEQEMEKKNRHIAHLRLKVLNLTVQSTRNP